MSPASPYIRWFDEIGLSELPEVGVKNASLGELTPKVRRKLSGRAVEPVPLVVPVQDVLEAMSLGGPSTGATRAAVQKAIEVSQQAVAAELSLPLERATVIDEFYVRGAPSVDLLLSRGLVDAAQPVALRVARRRPDLDDATLYEDLQDVNGVDYVTLDAERGRVHVTDIDLGQRFVRAAYTAGLAADGGDPALYVGVPDWLAQAVRLRVLIVLSGSPVIPPGSNQEKSPEGGVSQLAQQLRLILHGHVRYDPAATKPFSTRATMN